MINLDKINSILYESYITGNTMKGYHSIPCSICKKFLEDNPELDNVIRTHFHGSDFNICERKLFWNMLRGNKLSFSDKPFLNDGHLHEEMILNSIELDLPENYKLLIFKNGNEEIRDVLGFQLITHMDGVLIDKEKDIMIGLECKAVKDRNFKQYSEEDIKDINSIWYGQIQSYMFSNKIDLFYLIIKNRDTSKLHIPIRIEKDLDFILDRLNSLKATKDCVTESIRSGFEINIPDRRYLDKRNIECNFCPFKNECWNSQGEL